MSQAVRQSSCTAGLAKSDRLAVALSEKRFLLTESLSRLA